MIVKEHVSCTVICAAYSTHIVPAIPFLLPPPPRRPSTTGGGWGPKKAAAAVARLGRARDGRELSPLLSLSRGRRPWLLRFMAAVCIMGV